MKTRHGQAGAQSRPGALFHVVLGGCRAERLVRDEDDWRKMVSSIDAMLFWCGGRIFACRCEADRLELALESAHVPLGTMLRYVTVPYALHFNRVRRARGQVFRPLQVYRLQRAFHTEFVLWLHRPLAGAGWIADAAYREPSSVPWVDPSPVLEELGRGPGAHRQYRALRGRGVDEALAAAFSSTRGSTPHIRRRVRPAAMVGKRRQRALLRSVLWFVARHQNVRPGELAGRSRARRLCRARSLVTLVGVRWGVSVATIAALLDRDGSTLQESVLRLRARDPQGLTSAAEAILAALGDSETGSAGARTPNLPSPSRAQPDEDADAADPFGADDPGSSGDRK